MRPSLGLLTAAMLASGVAVSLAGCGSKTVAGRTYVTANEDTIEFGNDGKAVETNGDPQFLYPGQKVALGSTPLANNTSRDFKLSDGQTGGAVCTYRQDRAQLTLTCDDGETTIFVVDKDGSLNGPPEGMWGHAVFAHMTLKQ